MYSYVTVILREKPLIFFESLYQGVIPNLGYIKKGGRYSYLCDRVAPALSRSFHVDDCGVTEDILFSPYFELYNVSCILCFLGMKTVFGFCL